MSKHKFYIVFLFLKTRNFLLSINGQDNAVADQKATLKHLNTRHSQRIVLFDLFQKGFEVIAVGLPSAESLGKIACGIGKISDRHILADAF